MHSSRSSKRKNQRLCRSSRIYKNSRQCLELTLNSSKYKLCLVTAIFAFSRSAFGINENMRVNEQKLGTTFKFLCTPSSIGISGKPKNDVKLLCITGR